MYIKSLEELRSDIQILKDVYFNAFSEPLTDEKLSEALNVILLQKQDEMLRNKFITYPMHSIVEVLKELRRTKVASIQYDDIKPSPVVYDDSKTVSAKKRKTKP